MSKLIVFIKINLILTLRLLYLENNVIKMVLIR